MGKDGFGIFLIISVLVIIVLGVYHLTGWNFFLASGYILLLILLFVVYFFRDPERKIPQDENAFVSPADGKIVKIEEVSEDIFLHTKAIKISIFLSIFDVHINRVPADGTVRFIDYKKGQFLNAMNNQSSDINEASLVGIETEHGKILFKQIAGLIARRIVNRLQPGQEVKRGQRYGMIRFGSRTDVFVPCDVELRVKLNDHVKGGESILGIFK